MIPLVDIRPWRTGSSTDSTATAREVDDALRTSGFMMLTGHGVSASLGDDIRSAARRFFALPHETKARYAAPVYGRGWVGQGRETNSFYGESTDNTPTDLKESYTIGRPLRTGNQDIDREWFAENIWPAEVPELQPLCERYAADMHALYLDLLRICAAALNLPTDWFVTRSLASPHTFNINRYPPLTATGTPAPGQYRIAPHTDWGILTLLDRQPGYGGLEVQMADDTWVPAPYLDGALTINIGDLLARWTGDRWRSTRHRVLPPQDEAPDEDLVSLIMFCETDVDTVVTPIPGVGHAKYPPVRSADYLLERGSAATVA
ncbi:isopenicillin N synthase family oxygenase [Mycolicibacterium sp. CH28]|uniref:isopenicillin N synthase family dioxygenase n=1 Tax=Mycolicibacterium sp. CH28 TaxID=2512237 RepID=UPI001080FDFE|nr:2-oxoglutarate and iron-dependent oxygenase domain-containing protein [Mycolicibacterium sp. CH28]TGD85442.1 isopenicillin N synthase family oxygenase [Mycolicibacterium sp. CH28]